MEEGSSNQNTIVGEVAGCDEGGKAGMEGGINDDGEEEGGGGAIEGEGEAGVAGGGGATEGEGGAGVEEEGGGSGGQ